MSRILSLPDARSYRYGLRAIGLTLGIPGLPLGRSLELAAEADAAGLELLGAGDGFVENLSVMGALAARTRSAELFTCIMGWTRTPVTMALAGTTMQDLSNGRYRLGLGTMPREWSEGWHDIEAARPLSRMRDYVAAVRAAIGSAPGQPISYKGPFYRFQEYERPAPRLVEGPPIYLAATRVRMALLAAEIADGVIFNLMDSAAWLREECCPRVESELERMGRARPDFDAGGLVYCAIDDDRRRAMDLIRPALAFYFEIPYFGEMLEQHGMHDELRKGRTASAMGDRAAMVAAVSDAMVDTFALAGTPDEVREQIGRFRDLLDWVLLVPPVMNAPADSVVLARRIIATFAPTAVASSGTPAGERP